MEKPPHDLDVISIDYLRIKRMTYDLVESLVAGLDVYAQMEEIPEVLIYAIQKGIDGIGTFELLSGNEKRMIDLCSEYRRKALILIVRATDEQ